MHPHVLHPSCRDAARITLQAATEAHTEYCPQYTCCVPDLTSCIASTIGSQPVPMWLQVLRDPLFNALRTEQQLGYSVHSSPTVTCGVLGLLVSVISEQVVATVHARISKFLDGLHASLQSMHVEEFQEHVSSVSTALLEAPNNIDEQTDHHWTCIWSGQYDFYDKCRVRCC
jgi:secreted Zn-dependent insulinase-like peptidase